MGRTRRTVEQARADILAAAEDVLREVGPAGLRVAAVAKQAGMAHPNVLHHFGSREGLLSVLTTRALQRSTDRVVAAMATSVGADPENRPAALARVLDAVYEGQDGRLMAWLVLSGRVDESDRPDLEPLVQIAHRWREADMGPGDIEHTRRLILLAAMALIGDAIAGEGLVESLGLGEGDDGRRQFRAWLAKLLLGQIERDG